MQFHCEELTEKENTFFVRTQSNDQNLKVKTHSSQVGITLNENRCRQNLLQNWIEIVWCFNFQGKMANAITKKSAKLLSYSCTLFISHLNFWVQLTLPFLARWQLL